MKKKLLQSVLILIMIVMLFTGCRKIDPSIDYALLGTWRCDQRNRIVIENGQIKDGYCKETKFPTKNKDCTIEYQPYFKITVGKIEFYEKYTKCSDDELLKYGLLPKEGSYYYLFGKTGYFIHRNTIVLTNNTELIYNVNGNKLSLSIIGTSENYNEEYIEEEIFTRVEEAEITPVYTIGDHDEYPGLEELIREFEIL